MVMVLPAKPAVTPAGKPEAAPIPVADVVVCVIFVIAVLIQMLGFDDGAEAVIVGLIVIVAIPSTPQGIVPSV
ncbi:MAG: hypothetical protein KFKLKKLM_02427 [Flavobacteriales bacterium]|nr:hypothetical protein [Flavobacteriales bacterium]